MNMAEETDVGKCTWETLCDKVLTFGFDMKEW